VQPDFAVTGFGDVPVVGQGRADLVGEGTSETLFPVAGGDRVGSRVAETKADSYALIGGRGQQTPDSRLRLGEERPGHDQDAQVLPDTSHEGEPRFAGNAGTIGVKADQFGLRSAITALAGWARPQPRLLDAETVGCRPTVATVRNSAER
jgi:hypothetical protein